MPFERQLHRDVEILAGARAEIIRVRLDRRRVRVHERLEHILAVQLMHAIDVVRVALVECLADVLVGLAGQLAGAASRS